MASRTSVLTILLALTLPALAAAQRFELSPFVGYRLGGEVNDFDFGESFDFDESDSAGVTLDFALNNNAFIELLYSRQETAVEEGFFFGGLPLFDVDVEYWHAGGLYQWSAGQVRPFVVATLGITRFAPEPRDLDSETRFSAGLGAGVKLMFGEHFGIRLEGRGFTTFVDDNDEVFCDPFGCYGYGHDSVLWQFEGRAGLVFAF